MAGVSSPAAATTAIEGLGARDVAMAEAGGRTREKASSPVSTPRSKDAREEGEL